MSNEDSEIYETVTDEDGHQRVRVKPRNLKTMIDSRATPAPERDEGAGRLLRMLNSFGGE